MRVPNVSAWLPLLHATWAAYQRHNSQWLAAALAYFAAFAVAPLIIIVVAIAGAFLHGHQGALDEIYTRLPGPETVAVRQIVAATLAQPRHGIIAQIAGWAFFALAAIGLFASLQYALNTIWDVTPQKMGIWQTLRRRAVSFVMMLAVAALLLLSVIADAALGTVLA
ncbi:MAG: YhjD/YihY/BrkB family envelope integrity protein, partial [Candidatus Cybelea sp.]